MTISQYDLRSAATRNFSLKYQQSRSYGQKTGFLCHSHKDRDLALGLQQWLKEQGMELYIDWQDPHMPDLPDGTTADRIRTVIKRAEIFLFLATNDSMSSRWCPWELGFADGVKRNEQIALIATRDTSGNYYGNEYLHLYRRIDQATASNALQWFPKGSQSPQNLTSF
ncbi:toll/interleukin-1 receptor domain-containing protein [Achromobacter sp. 2789STDY5608615]|uniref:toll/interleukin-1 receptor domain-containing protein n=1 Tax=Achromobacter sp. 2789STDY5608615 TaxID=1806492 RepID=UPI0006C840F4|nr:toll/interleukin-1 receptor domain-containing protein [Achromobacter sp. 2789STDY5608615]